MNWLQIGKILLAVLAACAAVFILLPLRRGPNFLDSRTGHLHVRALPRIRRRRKRSAASGEESSEIVDRGKAALDRKVRPARIQGTVITDLALVLGRRRFGVRPSRAEFEPDVPQADDPPDISGEYDLDLGTASGPEGTSPLEHVGMPESYSGSGDEPDEEAPEPEPTTDGGLDYRVWFGTNRKPLSETDASLGYSGERSREVRYGFVSVHIPESHKIGSIGSSAIMRWITLTEDRLKVRRRHRMAPDEFWDGVKEQLLAVPAAERHAVVFIHGYNVSFDDAAIRAAQLGKDLGISGAMAFFSWPSKGQLDCYPADGATIEASEGAIADFLADFATRSGASAVHVIAHSMGNRGLLRAMDRIANDAQRRTGVRFGQFILAAPDVDVDTFLDLARRYKSFAQRSTLYISARDKAVGFSRWLHDYPRVGFAPPVSVFPDIDTVSVDNVDLGIIGHGYVGEARDVLQDMHCLIFQNLPPSRRFGLKGARTDDGEQYWVVGR